MHRAVLCSDSDKCCRNLIEILQSSFSVDNQKDPQTEGGCSKCLTERLSGRNAAFVDVHGF